MGETTNGQLEIQPGSAAILEFLKYYGTNISPLRTSNPGQFIDEITVWAPLILDTSNGSREAALSLSLLESAFRLALGNPLLETAVIDGLSTSILRTPVTTTPTDWSDFMESFNHGNPLEGNEKVSLSHLRQQNPVEYQRTLAVWIPKIISNMDNTFEGNLALGIVKQALEAAKRDPKQRAALVNGLLVITIVNIDDPAYNRPYDGIE